LSITHACGRSSGVCREQILADCRHAAPLHWTLIVLNNFWLERFAAGRGAPGPIRGIALQQVFTCSSKYADRLI